VTFLIADTFTDSLARLTGDEQKAAKTTAFDLQMDPSAPGLSFHKLDRGKDRRFWSVRVNADVRLIVHRTDSSLLLCYVDHHDKAYAWAERRKLETHPTTGAAQMIELRESVREVVVPAYVVQETPAVSAPVRSDRVTPATKPLANVGDEQLLAFGVPAEWTDEIREATEDDLLTLVEHLPSEAAEAVLELATGGTPKAPVQTEKLDPFEHPDARRRFRVVASVEELQRALDAPWEKWTVFLHPAQRDLVTRTFSGPARVAGSAGTGKTVVALHRAVHLARKHSDSRVLLGTFSASLAHALRNSLKHLIGNEPRVAERIDVAAMPALAVRLHQARLGPVYLATEEDVRKAIEDASAHAGAHRFSTAFLRAEWDNVVDAWQLSTWDAYRNVQRLGRRTRLPEAQRAVLWKIFAAVRESLRARGLTTESAIFHALAEQQTRTPANAFDFAVIDEAQDVSIAQLRFLAAHAGARPDALFFAGDLGQRIFQQPFSWKALGVDVRGRSRTLRVNYRTSHQIREQADRLLGPEVKDADGNSEDRRNTVSVFSGPRPEIRAFASESEEAAGVGSWLARLVLEGLKPREIAVFVRTTDQIPRAQSAVVAASLTSSVLDERMRPAPDSVSVATMHLVKGMEFRAVAVMACDDEVIPLQSRIADVGEQGDLEEIYDTERQLLYVACTRARDRLFVSGVAPVSEFLDDLEPSAGLTAAGVRA
jgi:superfamily I DNA/RNA helicase